MHPDDLTPARAPDYLQRIRYALDRSAAKGPVDAAVLREQARALLSSSFGVDSEGICVAAARGYVPLSGEHTHYFDGYALLLALPGGAAVAVRRAEAPGRVVVRLGETPPVVSLIGPERTHGRDTSELLARLLHTLRERLLGGASFEAAVVVALPDCRDALLGAVAVAATQALAELGGVELAEPDAVQTAAEAVQEACGRPYGHAYVLAAHAASPLALVDAATLDWEALEGPAPDQIGWALVDTGVHRSPGRAAAWERADVLREAVVWLQENGFETLGSLRSLEHRDLPRALAGLFGAPKRIVRHLVTEDRRVPRLVAALQKGDGQMLGAHLLMSQASLREDWQASVEEVEHVIAAAEEAEGIYGARMVGGGYGGCVLVVGRPFLLPAFLDTVATSFAARFGHRPGTMVL